MATRSNIGIEENGNVKYVYCHWDGYPSWVGAILKKYYNTEEKVKNLIELGSISSLARSLDETIFYIRDGNEKYSSCKPLTTTIKEYINHGDPMIEYLYLYNKDNGWVCYDKYNDEKVDIPN